jgi:predicted RNase H-like HicB family nuclease
VSLETSLNASEPRGFGSASRPAIDDGILIVVHPSGRLDDLAAATYWTEVPALPACCSEGRSVEEVVSATQAAITQWAGEHAVRVELAF